MSIEIILPAAPDSEIALLSLAVIDPTTVLSLESETKTIHFTGLSRPKLRDLVIELVQAHGRTTYAMLETEWTRRELPLEGLREIDAMRKCFTALEHAGYNRERLRSTALRRKAIKQAELLSSVASNGEPDNEVIERLNAFPAIASEHLSQERLVLLGQDIDPEIRVRTWSGKAGLVDLRMGGRFEGVYPGEVFVLLARSYVGKSLWASQAALNSKAATLVISLEMTASAWRLRMLQQALNLTRRMVVEGIGYGRWTPQQSATIRDIDSRIALSDKADGSFSSLQASVERHKALRGHKPTFLVIDHLGYLKAPTASRSLYERASECSTEVHRLARRNDLAVLLIVQVGRAEGTDGSTEIGMSSARDSGRIEEDADYLLGLWRPGAAKGIADSRRSELSSEIRGRLCKHRQGSPHAWNFRMGPNLTIHPQEEA